MRTTIVGLLACGLGIVAGWFVEGIARALAAFGDDWIEAEG